MMFFFIGLMGCSSMGGEQAKYGSRAGVLQLSQANKIVKEYLVTNRMSWGAPTSVRSAPGRYIYVFKTPKNELRKNGPRMLKINVHSGKVSIPTNSGRLSGGGYPGY